MISEGQRFSTSNLEADLNQLRQRSKKDALEAAFILWVVCGIYLFWTIDGAHFLSWQAAVYFIPGGLLAALVFGGLCYLLACGLVRLTRPMSWDFRRAANTFGSLAILAVQLTTLFFTAKFVLGRLVAMHL